MSNNIEAINRLNTVTAATVLTVSLFNFLPGTIGLILNIFVFTRPVLKHEPCSFYFLASSFFHLFVVLIILPVRIISNSFNFDLGHYNLVICKVEFFLFHVVRATSIWLILLPCIDRYFHSSFSVKLRQFSSLKIARLSTCIIILLMMTLYSHIIVYFEIANAVDQSGKVTPICNARKGMYRSFHASWHMTVHSLCPCFLMFLFGILTVKNIRQHRRISPVFARNNQHIERRRRKDRQILRMLTVQVLVIIVSTTPSCIVRLYSSFTETITKDAFRIAQENLGTQTANSLSYFAHSSSFYLYTLTGSLFRKELIKTMAFCLNYRQRRNQISLELINQQRVLP